MLAEPNSDREAALLRARQAGEALARASSAMDPRAMTLLSRSDPRRTEYEKAVAADQAAKAAVAEAERAAAPAPPSPRDALVAAVAKLNAAKTELTAARAAKAANAAEIGEAQHVEGEINGAIEKAQHEASVGTLPARDAAELIAQKRTMLAATREHIAILRDKDTGLGVRLKRADDAVAMAEIRYKRMLGEFLRQAPEVLDVPRRLHEAEREVAGLIAVCELIASAGGFGGNWRVNMPRAEPSASSKELAARWRAAIERLADDPAAALPSSG
jgi:hypothetical protein